MPKKIYRRLGRFFLWFFGCFILLSLVYVVVFPDPVYQTNSETTPGESTINDPRNYERTFTTVPEWYIVFSAQEYANYLDSGGSPTDFPFFSAIAQYGEIEETFIKAAGGRDSLDETTATVLATIGPSFAVEYGTKGLYETTVGRLTDYLNFRVKSREDITLEEAAIDYGNFLNHTPWYAFPYRRTLGEFWTSYGLSSITPRGLERRIVYTIGFALKGTYGRAINTISNSSYGGTNQYTTAIVSSTTTEILESIDDLTIIEKGTSTLTIALPRYRAFRDPILLLVSKGVTVQSIQGYHTILVSVISPKTHSCDYLSQQNIHQFPFVSNESLSRNFILIETKDLHSVQQNIHQCNLEIEHLFDF